MSVADGDEQIQTRTFDRATGQGADDRRIMRKRFSKDVRTRVLRRTDGVCYLCKKHIPPESPWHIEHVFAFSADPAANDVLGNLLPACPPCNLKKSNKCLLECMENDHFSIDSRLNYGDMSVQPRVKRILLLAVAKKHALRAGLGALDEKALAELCDDAQEKSMASLPELKRADVDMKNATLIGAGGQGKVYLARYNGLGASQPIAVKVINASPDFEREAVAMKEIMAHDPPSVVRYIGYVRLQEYARDEPDSRVWLAMELMDGDLNDLNGAGICFFLGDVKRQTLWIVTAVRLIHKLGFMHRDIKPLNILFSEKARMCKLADFGLVTDANRNASLTAVGSAMFHAPEIRNPGYTNKVDIYSFGMTMQYIKQATLRHETSVFLGDLHKRCAKYSPGDRPSAEALFAELEADQAGALAPPVVESMTHAPPAVVQPAAPAPPVVPPAAASSTSARVVYVTSLSDTRCKFHVNRGCCNATTAIDFAKARKERDPCSRCCDGDSAASTAAPAEKIVFVTSKSDKRGKYHSTRDCYGATERITLAQAKNEGRTKHC